MTTANVSPKFQVVIPLAVRQPLKLQPGTKLQITEIKGGLRLTPLTPLTPLRGSARGIDTQISRDDDRPL